MKKLAIVTTHPIQYYAPVFKLLASVKSIEIKVFYTWGKDSVKKFDPGFGKEVEWDIPVLEGYNYVFLKNTASHPGTESFRGIVNPDAVNVIDQFNPDAILVYGWAWQSHLQIIRHYSGKKPVWFRGDSTLLDAQNKIKGFVRYIFLRWVYNHIDLAFYVGTHNKKYFKNFGIEETQLKFAPHSIDNKRFSESQLETANAIRTRLSLTSEAILILFAGKLEPKKNPTTLLDAFLAIEEKNIYLLFVGNGVLEKTLKGKAGQSAKKEKIFFLDFQNQANMPAVYQACQIFCLPSVGPGETWGLAVNEAMAAHKAILVSDKVGCSADLVKKDINGSIFEAGNAAELSQKIKKLTESPETLERMGEASGKIIENWSFENQIAPILEEICKL